MTTDGKMKNSIHKNELMIKSLSSTLVIRISHSRLYLVEYSHIQFYRLQLNRLLSIPSFLVTTNGKELHLLAHQITSDGHRMDIG